MISIGIDTGGTFTDAVASDGRILKLPSNPDDPSRVVRAIVERLVPSDQGAARVIHGTTVATNAVLTGKLARVGLLVDEGLEALLEVRRQERPQLYAMEPRRPALPTGPELVRGIPGRLGPGGASWGELDLERVQRAGRELRDAGAEVLAVVLLHSYAAPDHEERVGRALADLGLPVELSSRVDPCFREVERGITTVINGALIPEVSTYLRRLDDALAHRHELSVITSEGGLATPDEVAAAPSRLLVSGPAGGLIAARRRGRRVHGGGLLTLDMGGTSTDVALIADELPRSGTVSIAGLSVRAPSLDIHTVGAGGGSIARRDAGGALAVGPESAGADPGPVAFGKGEELTVTDAHLLLGHLVPEAFEGGRAADRGAAERVAQRLARSLGVSLPRLLEGVIALADVRMGRALRVITLERGHDPREDLLVAFGGGGGLHAVALARGLGVGRVLVPERAGVLSAQGLLEAPFSRSVKRSFLGFAPADERAYAELAAPLVEILREGFRKAGHDPERGQLDLVAELRYEGQSFEVDVPVGEDTLAAFHAEHARRNAWADEERRVELVNLRATLGEAAELAPLDRRPEGGAVVTPEGRSEGVPSIDPWPWYRFESLRAKDRIIGPGIVVQSTATALIPGGFHGVMTAEAGLLIEKGS